MYSLLDNFMDLQKKLNIKKKNKISVKAISEEQMKVLSSTITVCVE